MLTLSQEMILLKKITQLGRTTKKKEERRPSLQPSRRRVTKITQLFGIFQKSQGEACSQERIIQELYDTNPYPEVSMRLWSSTRAKTTKLISRARQRARDSFGDMDGRIEWFPYFESEKAWKLYRVLENKAKEHI